MRPLLAAMTHRHGWVHGSAEVVIAWLCALPRRNGYPQEGVASHTELPRAVSEVVVMAKKMTTPGRQELIGVLRERYAQGSRAEKGRILDEFTLISGCHRKSAPDCLCECSYTRNQVARFTMPLQSDAPVTWKPCFMPGRHKRVSPLASITVLDLAPCGHPADSP